MMESVKTSASVHVLKLAAAKRQIDAAIRMYFMEEDRLAIATVAAAAHTLVRDLTRHRGKSSFAEGMTESLIALARGLARKDPEAAWIYEKISESAMGHVISLLVPQIEDAGAHNTINELKASLNLTIEMPAYQEKALYDNLHKVPNFLKHADRDPTQSIIEGDERVEQLISHACFAYGNIAGDSEVSPETLVFAATFGLVESDDMLRPRSIFAPGSLSEVIERIVAEAPPRDRKSTCQRLIRSLKELQSEESRS